MSISLSTGFLGLSQKENPARAWLKPNTQYGINASGWAYVDGKIIPYDDEAGRTGRRNSTAWEINAAGELVEFAIDEPRRTASGDVIEPASTNLFLNSTSPATQTVSLATGDNTLTVWGSGSVQIAANTATGTGFGTATDGSPVTVNITGAGSVDCTVTGSPTIVNLEAGLGTSPIVTAGSSVTRAADTLVATQGSGDELVPNTLGVDATDWTLGLGWSYADGQLTHTGATGGDVYIAVTGLTIGSTYRLSGVLDFTGDLTISNTALQARNAANTVSYEQILSGGMTPNTVNDRSFEWVATATDLLYRVFSEDEVSLSAPSITKVDPIPNFTSSGMGAAGWFTVDIADVADTSSVRTLFEISDGTANNFIRVEIDASDNLDLIADVGGAGAATAAIATGIDLTAGGKVSVAYDGTNVRACFNGGTVATVAKVVNAASFTELKTGCDQASSDQLDGATPQSQTGSGTLTDEKLQAL